VPVGGLSATASAASEPPSKRPVKRRMITRKMGRRIRGKGGFIQIERFGQ
jgi:hypothetical protein